ncbi:hypothetical protein [Flavobacterium pectinovorum]|uniref:Uncharacterized protein n=1 Tax=Flavobacterium pectinovorum TaxID=29533 RepID=A0A502EYN2_9FLAO|nr:hypothetical protein [Flavobacterium pectinovorum]TPG41506.1 hypothetical protein EAH81_08420 [Flavobacterium pectinovorum]
MANFGRNSLKFNYSWTTTEGDSKKVIGYPDNVLLNRNEGYEMLHFINKYMVTRNLSITESNFTTIEYSIKTNVPSDLRSQTHIKTWLDNNLK